MIFNVDEIISTFIVLWAVIDPIGTLPVFIAVTKGYADDEKKKIANSATLISFLILFFFLVVGEIILRRIGVSLSRLFKHLEVSFFFFLLST